MNEIGLDLRGVEIGAAPNRAEDRTERFRTIEPGVIELESSHGKISLLPLLFSEAAHFDWHRLRKFARQIVHVHPRPAINVRRVFVREEERFHEAFLIARARKRTQIIPARSPKIAEAKKGVDGRSPKVSLD